MKHPTAEIGGVFSKLLAFQEKHGNDTLVAALTVMTEAFKRKKVKKEKNIIVVDLTGDEIEDSVGNSEFTKDVLETILVDNLPKVQSTSSKTPQKNGKSEKKSKMTSIQRNGLWLNDAQSVLLRNEVMTPASKIINGESLDGSSFEQMIGDDLDELARKCENLEALEISAAAARAQGLFLMFCKLNWFIAMTFHQLEEKELNFANPPDNFCKFTRNDGIKEIMALNCPKNIEMKTFRGYITKGELISLIVKELGVGVFLIKGFPWQSILNEEVSAQTVHLMLVSVKGREGFEKFQVEFGTSISVSNVRRGIKTHSEKQSSSCSAPSISFAVNSEVDESILLADESYIQPGEMFSLMNDENFAPQNDLVTLSASPPETPCFAKTQTCNETSARRTRLEALFPTNAKIISRDLSTTGEKKKLSLKRHRETSL